MRQHWEAPPPTIVRLSPDDGYLALPTLLDLNAMLDCERRKGTQAGERALQSQSYFHCMGLVFVVCVFCAAGSIYVQYLATEIYQNIATPPERASDVYATAYVDLGSYTDQIASDSSHMRLYNLCVSMTWYQFHCQPSTLSTHLTWGIEYAFKQQKRSPKK